MRASPYGSTTPTCLGTHDMHFCAEHDWGYRLPLYVRGAGTAREYL